MSQIETFTTLVIVGISGDLAKRKLMPAIREISQSDVLPHDLRIIGITRRPLNIDEVLPAEGDNSYLRERLEIRQMDLDNIEAYKELNVYLKSLESVANRPTQRLFYLSIPPKASQPVVEFLGTSGLSAVPGTKLLLEKPFGTDLASAEELIQHIRGHFQEDQVYRIDHYLAKEMAQNLIVFRGGNSLFKRTWNHDFIESIEISASEKIGIEGRTAFYEQTGALRDVVQSHLLQLAALTLMELPSKDDWGSIPTKRLQALSSLSVAGDMADSVVRAQYRSYRSEVENPTSNIETFVSIKLQSSDPVWAGVPITLTTGKSLDRTATEIKICYKRDQADESNTLVLRIQPNEGAELKLWAKQPGYGNKMHQVPLNFSYSEHFSDLPEAYERVFVDAMRGERGLFTSSDEVLASWHVLQPIQDAWAKANDHDLIIYDEGDASETIIGEFLN